MSSQAPADPLTIIVAALGVLVPFVLGIWRLWWIRRADQIEKARDLLNEGLTLLDHYEWWIGQELSATEESAIDSDDPSDYLFDSIDSDDPSDYLFDSIDRLRKAIHRRLPSHEKAKACERLGWAFDQIGNSTESIRYYSKAIGHDSRITEAFYGRGLVRYRSERFSQALEDFQQVIEMDPMRSDAESMIEECRRQLPDKSSSHSDPSRERYVITRLFESWKQRLRSKHDERV